MKKHLMSMFLMAGLVVMAGAQLAQARIADPIVINIPFDFCVGEQQLPAGEYQITSRSLPQNLVQIRSTNGKVSVVVMVQAAWSEDNPAHPKLVFQQYDGKQYLTAIFEQGNREGSAISKSELVRKEAADEHAAPHAISF